MSFNEITLEDTKIEIIDGDRGKNYPKQNEFLKSGYCVFLNAKNVTANGFVFEEKNYITNEKDKNLRKGKMQRGDIVLTTRGTVGNVAFYDINVPIENMRINSGMVIIRTENDHEFISEFIYWLFRSSLIQNQIDAIKTGSAQPQLPISIMKKLKIIKPGIYEQKKIIQILSKIEAKIQANKKINENLQSISQLLFKHWFVDFEFPNEEGLPYKSSGGEMVDSELGMIPKGWEVKIIQDICNIRRGASPRPIQDFMDESKQGIPWIKISDVTSINTPFLLKSKEYIKKEGKCKSVFIKEGTLILSNSATPGIPKFIEFKACVHDGWLILDKYDSNYKSFIYFLLLSLRKNLINLSNGSVFNNLKTDIVKNYKFINPNKNVLNKFEKIVYSLMNTILNNCIEIKRLEELRDTLLLKLMNGEIDLSNIEISQ